MTSAVVDRLVRRETHSPRTVATVVVLVAAALAAVYAGVEIVLHLLGSAPLLVSPGAALTWVRGVPELPQGPVVAVGVLTVVLGIVLAWLALAPGRRPRHLLAGPGHASVADNGVIASALAECLRRELDLPRGAVVVGVGHRSADVTVRPDPGQSVDRERVRAVAESELGAYDLVPRVRVRVRVLRVTDEEGRS